MRTILLDTVLYPFLSLRRISMDRFRNVLVDMRRHTYLPRLLLATSALNDYSWNYTANL